MNLLDLMVRIGVDDQASDKVAGIGSDIGSKLSTAAKAGVAAVGAAVTAIGGMALKATSDYEQLSGGVAKLYGSGQTLIAFAQEQGRAVAEVRDEYDSLNPAVALMSQNAANAWRTAGMSANQYMEQATSFSAALINSLGGDTVKAAEMSDVAMRAMSDNVNTFGSNAEDVQNAIQGISKQNYTTLDNLKLGYGGTKEEMQRLIDDANKWGAANGEASNLSIDSFADCVQAIQQVQEAQGIAGTTAREGATTIEGSVNEVKAAWENLLAGFGSQDADFGALTDNLVTALGDAAGNILPAVSRIAASIANELPQAMSGLRDKLAPVLSEALAGAWDVARQGLSDGFGIQLPDVDASQFQDAADAVGQLADGLGKVAPAIMGAVAAYVAWKAVTTAAAIAQGALNAVMSANPAMLVIMLIAGLVAALVTLWTTNEGFRDAVTGAWNAIVSVVSGVVAAIVGFFTVTLPAGIQALAGFFAQLPGQIGGFLLSVVVGVASWAAQMAGSAAQAGIQFLANVGNALASLPSRVWTFLSNALSNAASFASGMASKAAQAARDFGSALVNGLASIPGRVAEMGRQIIDGLVNGIKNGVGAVTGAIKDVADSAVNAAKNALGIHSPSRVFAALGRYVAQGLEVGISGGEPGVRRAVRALADSAAGAYSPSLSASIPTASATSDARGGGQAGELAAWLDRNLGRIIEEHAPTATPREFGRMVRSWS